MLEDLHQLIQKHAELGTTLCDTTRALCAVVVWLNAEHCGNAKDAEEHVKDHLEEVMARMRLQLMPTSPTVN